MKQQVNLYQRELKRRSVAFSAVRMAQCLLLLIVGLVALQTWNWLAVKPLRAQAASAENALIAAEDRLESVRIAYPPPVPDPTLATTLRQRRAVLAQTEEIAFKLDSGAFGTTAGLSAYLTGFARQHIEGTWLTGVRVVGGGSALALEGKSLMPELVPAYLERLADEKVFQGKTFSDLQLRALNDGLEAIGFAISTAGVAPRDDS